MTLRALFWTGLHFKKKVSNSHKWETNFSKRIYSVQNIKKNNFSIKRLLLGNQETSISVWSKTLFITLLFISYFQVYAMAILILVI